MRVLLCAIFFLPVAALAANTVNNDPNEPNNLLRAKWNGIETILQNKEIDKKEKEKQIEKIARPLFNFELMAKLALGKKNWSRFNAEQQKKFTALFIKKLSVSYSEKVMLYKDQRVVFKPAVKKKKSIYLPMELKSRNKTIVIVYKFHKNDKHWKIYDVEIEGVSILLTYRSQFNDILRRGTVEQLLSQLEKPKDD